VITLRFGGYQPARSVHTRALDVLRAAASRRLDSSGVAIDVVANITERGQKASDLLAMVEAGDLDGCYFASSYLAGRVPALTVFDLPFRAGRRATVFPALDGAAGEHLAGDVARATGFRVLGYWDNGIRHISNAVRAIRRPADCAGLRLRTLDNALHQSTFRALGFDPVHIDVAGLARAVADGTVDAQENPLTNLVNFRLDQYHRHVSLTGHLLGVALLLVNRARWDALPPDVRDGLRDAARESEAAQRRFASDEDDTCLEFLRTEGVAILPDSSIDLVAFRTAVGPGVGAQAAAIDPALRRALLDA
jgi:TRAP-type transport system periplasmic protein